MCSQQLAVATLSRELPSQHRQGLLACSCRLAKNNNKKKVTERERKNACERGHVYPRMERLCVGECAVQECVRFTDGVSSAEGRPVFSSEGWGA